MFQKKTDRPRRPTLTERAQRGIDDLFTRYQASSNLAGARELARVEAALDWWDRMKAYREWGRRKPAATTKKKP